MLEEQPMRHPSQELPEIARSLVAELRGYARRTDVVVLALTTSVRPLAAEVARALQAPLDLFQVWPLVSPRPDCVQIGAVASGGVLILDTAAVRVHAVAPATIARIAQERSRELVRYERALRGDLPPVDVRHRKVIVVDDGRTDLATWRLTAAALKRRWVASVVAASASMPTATCRALLSEIDEVVAALCDDLPKAGLADLAGGSMAPIGAGAPLLHCSPQLT
jgi:putative phosphoribosyl transferase